MVLAEQPVQTEAGRRFNPVVMPERGLNCARILRHDAEVGEDKQRCVRAVLLFEFAHGRHGSRQLVPAPNVILIAKRDIVRVRGEQQLAIVACS